jgi:hypothetical protein
MVAVTIRYPGGEGYETAGADVYMPTAEATGGDPASSTVAAAGEARRSNIISNLFIINPP